MPKSERFTRHVARDRDMTTRPSVSAILSKCFTCPFDTVFERSGHFYKEGSLRLGPEV